MYKEVLKSCRGSEEVDTEGDMEVDMKDDMVEDLEEDMEEDMKENSDDSRLEEMEERRSVEQKQEQNNPWAEDLEAGPGDSEKVFLRTSIAEHLVVESFSFWYRTTSIHENISFVSLSDQDRMIETVSNKFAIIQISQPMNGSLIRKTE